MRTSALLLKLVLTGLVMTTLQALVTAPPAAAAAVRWASPTGTGTECTQATPCSLDTAVEDAAVQDGDEVVVMPGAYSVLNLQVDDAITLHGEAGQPRPTITTNDSFAVFVTDAATLRDLSFVHTVNSSGVLVSAAGAVVERITSKMTESGGSACTPNASSTWRDSVCWATGVNTRGMGLNGQPGPGTYTLTLRNLTLVGGFSGLGLDYDGAGVNAVVDAKNVIANSAGDDVRALATHGASVQFTLAHSNYAEGVPLVSVGGGTATVTDPGTGTNQTDAPVFVDAANGDFHQAAGSPTIDAGVVDAANGATDFEGDPRAARGTTAACPAVPDIGADERVTALECDPPETSITSGPDSTTTDTTPTFELTTDEPGAFECRVDAGGFAPCATPYTTETLGLGAHTVYARATDLAGNVDATPATRTFTVVPVVVPDTTFTQTPKRKVKTKKKRATVTFAFTSTPSGGFECSLDGAAFTACASPLTFKAKLGRHELRVRAVSGTGVVDPTPAAYAFKVKRKR